MYSPNWYTLRDEVKASTSCIDYLNKYCSQNIHRQGQHIIAPRFIRPDSDSPSFAVWDDSCTDFVTGQHYDVIDLCALDRFNGDKSLALEFLAGRKISPKHSDDTAAPSFSDTLQKLQDRVIYWHNQLLNSQQAIDYLASRHISLDTAKALKLGFSPNRNRIIFPYFSRSYGHPAVYFAGRDISGNAELRYQFPSSNDKDFAEVLDHIPYGIHSARPGSIVQDTVTDKDTGQIVKLDTHNIRYDYLCITEGNFDIISFIQDGWACMSGKKNSAHLKEFLAVCRQYRDCGQKVFICFDNDNAGSKFQRDLAGLLLKNRVPFFVGRLPKEFKDVSDYYAAGGSLEELVRNAQRGVEYLAEFCSTVEELQGLFTYTAKFYHKDKMQLEFLRRKALSLADPETETITDDNGQVITNEVLRPRFDRITVKELLRQASSPLMDSEIAHMVMDSHNLKYDISGSFYEYGAGVWKAVHNTIIEKYIIEAMGEHINNGKMQGVRRFMQSLLAGEWLFNAKPVFTFENGTLHLDEPFETVQTVKRRRQVLDENGKPVTDPKLAGSKTIMDTTLYEDYEEVIHTPLPNKEMPGMPANFRKHSPDDMCTYKVGYNYVPDAVNTELEKALDAWFEGDEQKKRLARQEAGYILFASCCMQKFFFLIGDGANGKSTFLHIIEAIFGREHGSSLSAERMKSGFDIMLLHNSMYNMSYDTAADLTGCEETIKAVSSGDPIVGAHKGVDAQTFRTRSKLFIAGNKHFSANDVSRGLLRRIVFLGFNNIFRKNEADPDIEDKILADLPGLFNWAYQGYLDLKASGGFCETKEQEILMEEFKEQLSGTLCFFRDFTTTWSGERVLDEMQLYRYYKEWANDNGEKIASKKKFIAEFRQVLRVEGSDVKAERDEDTRKWMFIFPERPQQDISDDDDAGDDSGGIPQVTEAPKAAQEDRPQQNSSSLPQQEGKVDRQISADFENDLEIADTFGGIFVHKFKYGNERLLSETEARNLAVEPKKSVHYQQLTNGLKLSEQDIYITACRTLAHNISSMLSNISYMHFDSAEAARSFGKSSVTKDEYSPQKITLALRKMMDDPRGWRGYINSLGKSDPVKAAFFAASVQLKLAVDPLSVMAFVQNDGAVFLTGKLQKVNISGRTVFRQFDRDSGWNEDKARSCFLTWVKHGPDWKKYLLYWAASQTDPYQAYFDCIDALATYCLRKNFIADLKGLSEMVDFAHPQDRANHNS